MSRAMTMDEFELLVKHIQAEHPPYRSRYSGKDKKMRQHRVKYIYPSIDMRDNKVFAVGFSGFTFADETFHTQNECRELSESLFDRIMNWLDEGI